MAEEMREAVVIFPADHPAGAGHFPGNPILPGALLLDAVWRCVSPDEAAPCRVRQAKFLRIVRPGERMAIRWRRQAGGIAFECFTAGSEAPAVTGQFA